MFNRDLCASREAHARVTNLIRRKIARAENRLLARVRDLLAIKIYLHVQAAIRIDSCYVNRTRYIYACSWCIYLFIKYTVNLLKLIYFLYFNIDLFLQLKTAEQLKLRINLTLGFKNLRHAQYNYSIEL